MKILSASQMQRIDRTTSERYGVHSLTLMENAGQGVTDFLMRRLGPIEQHRIVILCGRGNNGGDGFVVARRLRQMGLEPRVVLFAEPESLRGDAAVNFERFTSLGAVDVAENLDAWRRLMPSLAGASLLIDALLGTGLSKPLEGFLAEVVRDINRDYPAARVVAVDLPSGISADQGEIIGEHIHADYSVTFTAPKIAHVFPPACERVGEWVVRSIGTPPQALDEDPELSLNLCCREDAAWIAEPRERGAHKGDFGHVLILAGSLGKTGAAAMAAKASLRAGAGLATIATAESALPIVASLGMEFMTEPLPETEAGTISLRALDYGRLEKLWQGKSVLAVGPGIGTFAETAELARTVVNKCPHSVVLDADGLNAFAGCMSTFRADARPPGATVLTPHPGEMARLTGLTTAEVQARRVEVARQFAQQYRCHLVLKGFRTLTAAPDGQVWVNPTGNPGMASGGTGDVLTGLIAGLLAQYPGRPITQVVAAAVYLHGLAGDLAAQDVGEASLIAGDILEYVPRAYRALTESGAAGCGPERTPR